MRRGLCGTKDQACKGDLNMQADLTRGLCVFVSPASKCDQAILRSYQGNMGGTILP